MAATTIVSTRYLKGGYGIGSKIATRRAQIRRGGRPDERPCAVCVVSARAGDRGIPLSRGRSAGSAPVSSEWLDLLAEDLLYFMPVRRNVKFGQQAERENTRQGEGIAGSTRTSGRWGNGWDRFYSACITRRTVVARDALGTNVRLLDVAPSVEARGQVTVGAGSWYIRTGWNTRISPLSGGGQMYCGGRRIAGRSRGVRCSWNRTCCSRRTSASSSRWSENALHPHIRSSSRRKRGPRAGPRFRGDDEDGSHHRIGRRA